MRPLHIVVLGGTGFVGRHLVARLVRAGHRVSVLTRNRNRDRELLVLPGVQLLEVDPYDADALAERLRGADAAINLIGILNERGDSGAGFQRVYVELTEGLVAACKKAGVRRVLQMSALNAGRGHSHYLRARGEAEAALRGSGLDWTLFQPSVIFGPGDGLFFRFAQLLAIAPVLPLARADARFAPVYVGDVAEAFARALADPASIGQAYELYGPQVMSLAEIVRYTARHRGMRRLVLPLPDALGRLQALVCDFIPGKPFSRDNFRSLLTPSVGGIDGLYRLGIERTPVDAVMPALLRRDGRQRALDRYRRLATR
jgi:uncharacterized protein YbjT (DUF2867 family)